MKGFRFQKRVTIFPGLRVNLSKSGISTTLGVRGASVNFGNSPASAMLGIPGTGLSYRRYLNSNKSDFSTTGDLPNSNSSSSSRTEIVSQDIESITSIGFDEIKLIRPEITRHFLW